MKNIIEYFKAVADESNYIEIKENVVGGRPTIKNRRISVPVILSCLKHNMTVDEIAEDYDLTREQVIGAIDYVMTLLTKPFKKEV